MLVLTLLAVCAVALPFLIYPALLWCKARLAPAPVRSAGITPPVDLIICAHNEANVIRARLDNALALDYPPERLTVWVASDGSTDATVALARERHEPRIRVLDLPRAGKAATLSQAVKAGRAPVIAFSDANSSWSPDALRKLVAPLHDRSVGGVAGDQRYSNARPARAEDSSGERGYWSFDRQLKRWQAEAGNVISATGAIYCVRRELFEPPPPDATDDFMISTAVVAAGYRLTFAPDAQATEAPASSAGTEFQRKVRVISRGLRGVLYRRQLLDPRRTGFYAFQLLVHKLLRRLVWMPALLLVLMSPFALMSSGLPQVVAVAVLTFVTLAAAGICSAQLRRIRVFAVPAYIAAVNVACMVATYNLLRGRRISSWHLPRPRAGAEPR